MTAKKGRKTMDEQKAGKNFIFFFFAKTKEMAKVVCLPADDFVRKQHATHFVVAEVVAPFVLDHLKREKWKLFDFSPIDGQIGQDQSR